MTLKEYKEYYSENGGFFKAIRESIAKKKEKANVQTR